MRILGIDLGTKTVRAVEVDSSFGRYEVHEYHEATVTEGQTPYQVAAQLLSALPRKPDKICALVPTAQVTFRNLQLPTRDKRAIQASIGFELEDELPFPSDQTANDYSILAQGKSGTTVHVAATLKNRVSELIARWIQIGVDPDTLTTEGWAFRAYCNRVLTPAQQSRPVLLIHIGHSRTILYVHWRGSPLFLREIPWGGADLTKVICVRFGVPMDQAEKMKLEHGFVLDEARRVTATQEQQDFSDAVISAIDELAKQVRQTDLTSKSHSHQNIGLLMLSGATTQLPGFSEVVEEILGIPVLRVKALSSIAHTGVTYSEPTDSSFLPAIAAAMTLVANDKTSVINFRKGEFARKGLSPKLQLSSLKKPLLAAGAISFTLLMSLIVESAVYRSRLTETDQQLERSIRSFFGQIAGSAVRGYLADTTKLKAAINKEVGKQRELSKLLSQNPRSPLENLKDLSASIPKDAVVDMIQYQIGSAPGAPYSPTDLGAVSLTFVVSSPQTADRLATLLTPKLTGIQRGKTEEVTFADTKKWKVTFTGKATEESYGR